MLVPEKSINIADGCILLFHYLIVTKSKCVTMAWYGLKCCTTHVFTVQPSLRFLTLVSDVRNEGEAMRDDKVLLEHSTAEHRAEADFR